MDLSVLQNLKVTKPEISKRAKYETVCKSGGDFVVTKNGAIYFSEQFIEELTTENGSLKYLDMIDGRLMKFEANTKVPFLFVGILPPESKVASITGTEGKLSFVKKKLLPLITDLYSINWENTNQVEFKLLKANPVAAFNNIHYVPRINKKGELKYVRRENASIFPCVPVEVLKTSKDDGEIQLD